MKLDRLLALIRLANNNPNENEANLAARKVCQILVSGEFTITPKQVKTAAGKMNEARTWNDVKRSTEPEFRSKQYGPVPPNDSDFDPIYEFFRGGGRGGSKSNPWTKDFWDGVKQKRAPTEEEEARRNEEKRKQHASNYGFYSGGPRYNPFKSGEYSSGLNEDEEWQFDITTGTRKRVKKQEMRKCAKCGLEIMTARLKEDPWICNPCHWKDKL
jgi:hypothetical protein